MKKWIFLVIALVTALAGWLIAGPYLALHGIRQALQTQDMHALERHIDFPTLRNNLRMQVQDHLTRRIGPGMRSHPLGSLAHTSAHLAIGRSVETLVTPSGINALLQGHSGWKYIADLQPRPNVPASTPIPAPTSRPLQNISHRFESPSRFILQFDDQKGRPVQCILTRQGLHWRVTDIRLPLAGE